MLHLRRPFRKTVITSYSIHYTKLYEWRQDRVLRKLEALLIVMDKTGMLMISGGGEVIEPDDDILAIGSGGNYALSAARALKRNAAQMEAKDIVRESLQVASEICVFTNSNIRNNFV